MNPATAVFAALVVVTTTTFGLDLDGDGAPDRVVLSQGDGKVVIRVRYADRSHAPQMFSFPVDPGREDGVCAIPVRLQTESLDYDPAAAVDGFVRSKRAHGFAIVDGLCDSLHFFWNHRTHRLDWWRA